MEIQELNRWGALLEEKMKLRSLPIAMKFCASRDEVPGEAVFPKEKFGKHMALCQTFSYTRMKGMTIAMGTGDHWCWTPPVSFGNVDCDPGTPAFEEVCKVIGVQGQENARRFFAAFPRLPRGKYPYIVTAPLRACTFVPDIVMVYAEAAKINHLCNTVKTVVGGTFTSVFDGIDSCIYCTIPSFEKNEFRITFPDPGDRERGLARDDEVILTIPGGRLKEFMDVFEARHKNRSFGDSLFEFNLDFPHPPFYNTLFEMWGLDEGEEWDVSHARQK